MSMDWNKSCDQNSPTKEYCLYITSIIIIYEI